MYNSVVRMWKKHMIDEKGVDKAVQLNWMNDIMNEYKDYLSKK